MPGKGEQQHQEPALLGPSSPSSWDAHDSHGLKTQETVTMPKSSLPSLYLIRAWRRNCPRIPQDVDHQHLHNGTHQGTQGLGNMAKGSSPTSSILPPAPTHRVNAILCREPCCQIYHSHTRHGRSTKPDSPHQQQLPMRYMGCV